MNHDSGAEHAAQIVAMLQVIQADAVATDAEELVREDVVTGTEADEPILVELLGPVGAIRRERDKSWLYRLK